MLSSLWYYLSSMPTLLQSVEDPVDVAKALVGLDSDYPKWINIAIAEDKAAEFQVGSKVDIWGLKKVCLDRVYESDLIQLRDGWTMLDVGAGCGAFTISAAVRCPNSKIFAIEPLPTSFARLQEGVQRNECSNVTPLKVALGQKDTKRRLRIHSGIEDYYFYGGSENEYLDGDREVEVEFISLERALFTYVRNCDLLKVSCRGAEYEMFLGLQPPVFGRIARIAVEFHEFSETWNHRYLKSLFEDRGYVVAMGYSKINPEIGYLHAVRREMLNT